MIGAAPPNAGRAIARLVPRCDARTVQRIAVEASLDRTYRAILDADLAGSAPARALIALGQAPDRVRALVRHEAVPFATGSDAKLGVVLSADSPWTVLVDEPPTELVLGLLWSPPAGGTKRGRDEWASFSQPGFAKVVWGFALARHPERGTWLTTETRTVTTDATGRRRFRAIWPFIRPFAALLRLLVLRAIRDEAERSAGREPRDVER